MYSMAKRTELKIDKMINVCYDMMFKDYHVEKNFINV